MMYRGERSTSVRKINRKFPYVHPGVKRGHVAKLLVAVDQSGSVGDEALEQVFSVLSQLSKKVTFVVCAFDTEMDKPWEWKKGMKPEPMRVRSGGTDFEAPTRWVNDPKRRGEFDGMIIITDGIAPRPSNSRVKRGWILTPGCKLEWQTDEMVVTIDPEKKG
jgi:predicted metal-dependent peptidase